MSEARITPAVVRVWPRWSELDGQGRKIAISALLAEGCSASGVAAKLSTTRGAVLGFCHRNGLPFGAGAAGDGFTKMRPKADRSAAGGYATRKKAGVTLAGPAVGRRPGADDEIPAGSHGGGAAPAGREGNHSGEARSPEPTAVASAVGPSCPSASAPGGAAPSDPASPGHLPRKGGGNATADDAASLPASGPIGFHALTDTRCKRPLWPDGPPPRIDAMLFCGEPSEPGLSWCPRCARMLLAGAPQPERRAWRGG